MLTGEAASVAATNRTVRLLKDAGLNLSGNFVSGMVALLLVPIMYRKLGAEAFGLWIVTLSVSAVAMAFDLGLGSTVTRVVATAAQSTERAQVARFLGTAFATLVLLTTVTTMCLGLVVLAMTRTLDLPSHVSRDAPKVIALLSISFFADQLTLFAASILGGLRRFGVINAGNAIVGAVRAGGIIVILTRGGTIVHAATWQMAVGIGACLMFLEVASRLTSRSIFAFERPRFGELAPHLSYGLSSFLVTVLGAAVWQLGPITIGLLGTSALVTAYHVGLKMPLAVAGLSSKASIVLFPAAGELERDQELDSTLGLLQIGTRSLVVLLLPACISLEVFAPEIVTAWLGEAPRGTVAILRVATAAVFAEAVGAASLQIAWGQGRAHSILRVLVWIATLSGTMTIALFLLVGSIGAVIALLTSLSAAALSYVALAARASGSSARVVLRKVFARMHYPLIASLSVAITLKYLTNPGGWATLLASIGATAGAFCCVFYAVAATGEERRVLRRILARVVPLMIIEGARSTWYFLIAMREAARGTPGRVRAVAFADYDRTVDPWGYSTQWGTEHLRKTDLLLDCALQERTLANACEVGCGEGFISERVAARVHQVLALDISTVALQRARDRCATLGGIRFCRWDLLTDAPPGVFDLVLAMGVLECFTRPSHLGLALDKIGQMMAPGGYLLATTTRQHPSIEESRWAALLVRGTTQMHRFVLRYPSLEAVAEEWTSTHHFALYRKKRQGGER